MKKGYALFYLMIISLMILGCGSGQLIGSTVTPTITIAPTETPVPTGTFTPAPTPTPLPPAPATVANLGLIPKGSQGTLIGKICLPDSQHTIDNFSTYLVYLVSPDQTCNIIHGKTSTDIQKEKIAIRVWVPSGDSKNQMSKLPDNYRYSDFKINTDDGEIVGENGSISITFIDSNDPDVSDYIGSEDIITIKKSL